MTTIPGQGPKRYSVAVPGASTPAHRGGSGDGPTEPIGWGVGPLPWAMVAAAIILVLDVNTPLGHGIGALYSIPVLIASLTFRRSAILAVAGICSALIALGMLVSPGAGPKPEHFVNRGIALLAVWVPAAIALRFAAVRAAALAAAERERHAASELHESMRTSLNKLLTFADQIGRSSAGVQVAAQRIRGRAQVMLTTLGLLSRSRGAPVDLATVLRSMLPAVSPDVLTIQGPPAPISPRQVPAIVQVFHELLANCRAHGALSTDKGRIEVAWTVEPVPGEHARRIDLTWREHGRRAAAAPPTPGYGTSVISATVVHDLSGSVELTYPEGGCRHHFRFILDEAHAGGRPGGW